MTKKEQEKMDKEIKAFLDKHEQVISVGLGALILSTFIFLAIFFNL